MALGSSIFAQIPSEGLIAYFPLNGDAVDLSGNNHNGLMFGDIIPTHNRLNEVSAALHFNGSGYILVSNHDDFIMESVTVSLWVNLETTGEINFIDQVSTGAGFELGIRSSGSINGVYFQKNGLVNGSNVSNYVDSGSPPTLNEWVHIVGVYDSNVDSLSLYLNGTLTDQQFLQYDSVSVSIYDLALSCGAEANNSYHLSGSMDDVRIYNRALPIEEIQSLYHEWGWELTEGVYNITVQQRVDGSQLVDIHYNLSGDSLYYQVSLEASLDGGMNYSHVSNATGDVSFGVTPWSDKHILWDIGSQYSNQFSSSTRVRINAIANDTPPGAMVDIDGNVYQTIQIGNQVWMAENLSVTHYRNGDPIPTDWPSYSGAHALYNNNANNEVETYGALYNWYAVVDSRNIAPTGWHIPTDAEWKELEMYLGMSQTVADQSGWRGTNEGSKLAGNTALWNDGALEDNPEFGNFNFTALPGGHCDPSSLTFSYMGTDGYFWSSSESSTSESLSRDLNYQVSSVARGGNYKRYGFSVRCVRD